MRVISLLPAASEIVAYLGATEHLVGITHACDFPTVIGARPRVTRPAPPHTHDEAFGAERSHFKLDKRLIRALHPDLILTQALCEVCAVSETDARSLAASISPEPAVVTLGGSSIDGVMADITAVANALGVADEAEELIAGEHARLRAVHERLKSNAAPRPRVLVIEWTDPIFIAGHWVPEQIRRAGGHAVLGEPAAHSAQATRAACEEAQPEVVIVAPCGFSLAESAHEAERLMREWTWLAERDVWAMDANGLISRPGPRVVDGVETMARIFNPGLFSPIDSRHAQQVTV